MKLSCNVIDDLLPLYLDGVCSAESGALVEEHLQECPDCRRKAAALRQEEEEPVPAHLEEAKSVEELARELECKVRLRRTLLVAAAAVLLLVAGIVGFRALYHWYYYEDCFTVPTEDIAVLESGVDEHGKIYYTLDVLPEDLPYAYVSWHPNTPTEEKTLYVQLKTCRKAWEDMDDTYRYWDTFCVEPLDELNHIYAKYYDRVVYIDDDGNELVIYDVNAED